MSGSFVIPWTAEEDAALVRLRDHEGGQWAQIGRLLMMARISPTRRSAQACRMRWRVLKGLRAGPGARNEWSRAEDAALLRLRKQGATFAEIAEQLPRIPGRPRRSAVACQQRCHALVGNTRGRKHEQHIHVPAPTDIQQLAAHLPWGGDQTPYRSTVMSRIKPIDQIRRALSGGEPMSVAQLLEATEISDRRTVIKRLWHLRKRGEVVVAEDVDARGNPLHQATDRLCWDVKPSAETHHQRSVHYDVDFLGRLEQAENAATEALEEYIEGLEDPLLSRLYGAALHARGAALICREG